MMPAMMLVPKNTRVVCSHSSTVADEPNSNLRNQLSSKKTAAGGR